ncbi:hypothetical protein D3C80_858990 [compost metagenome]
MKPETAPSFTFRAYQGSKKQPSVANNLIAKPNQHIEWTKGAQSSIRTLTSSQKSTVCRAYISLEDLTILVKTGLL